MSKQQSNSDTNKMHYNLISLSEASELSGLSKSHLRLLVRKKILWGQKIGRNWVTTEDAVKQYLAQERRPGPKTDG